MEQKQPINWLTSIRANRPLSVSQIAIWLTFFKKLAQQTWMSTMFVEISTGQKPGSWLLLTNL